MRIALDEAEALATAALTRAGACAAQAEPVARSVRAAEAEGARGIGLGYLPWYCRHLTVGKIRGDVLPDVTRPGPGVVRADAQDGFAHPAYEAGEALLIEAARGQGIAILCVANAYASGVVGYFADRLARAGLVAIATTNASSTVAPWGGRTPFFGTNPIAFGAPRGGDPLVVDFASSATAYVNVAAAAAEGRAIPPHWALDAEGQPTTDAARALEGSVAPMAGHKGFGLGLMVEILSAGLTGSRWSFEASSLGDDAGGPPRLGQSYIAIDPARMGGGDFTGAVEAMLLAMLREPGVRVPGDRRAANRRAAEIAGIGLDDALAARLAELAGRPVRTI